MDRINEIMILNDGETFTGLAGCARAVVLYDADADGGFDEEKWDEKVAEYTATLDEAVWEDLESGIIAKIVERF